jgi:hypothetical protein
VDGAKALPEGDPRAGEGLGGGGLGGVPEGERLAVLVPRNSSGKKRMCSPWLKAHSKIARAFEEVHTAPPRRPTKALTSAVEFWYVMGTTPPGKRGVSTSQARAASRAFAMRAIGQSASRTGCRTVCSGAQRMAAVSAIKETPQKTMYSASVAAACSERPNESPRKSAQRITSSRW